ncbi:MNIO family bufferin maturase [Methylocystis sp. S23]
MQKPAPLGYGLGLRPIYFDEIMSTRPPVDWFEIISENYMVSGGKPLSMLDAVRADYPVVMHGVSMSLASTDPLDFDYLAQLKALIERVAPAWVSDHVAWTGVHGLTLHDLLPIPYTCESLAHIVERICRVQDYLKRRLVVENASTYVSFSASEMSEQEFVKEMAERADCLLLLDVNNVFVSSFNHGFDPVAFIDAVPVERVVQFHMAGHTNHETHRVDTHDQPVCEEVWALYEHARRRFGDVSAMIERDDNFPPFSELLDELQRMRDIDVRIAAGHSLSAA